MRQEEQVVEGVSELSGGDMSACNGMEGDLGMI